MLGIQGQRAGGMEVERLRHSVHLERYYQTRMEKNNAQPCESASIFGTPLSCCLEYFGETCVSNVHP